MEEKGNNPELKTRKKAFALAILRLYTSLPNAPDAQVLGRQVMRSGTSVGAHYREGQRAKSDADLISKIEGLLQELSETEYWLELLRDSGICKPEQVNGLLDEANQLTGIFVTIVKKVKARRS